MIAVMIGVMTVVTTAAMTVTATVTVNVATTAVMMCYKSVTVVLQWCYSDRDRDRDRARRDDRGMCVCVCVCVCVSVLHLCVCVCVSVTTVTVTAIVTTGVVTGTAVHINKSLKHLSVPAHVVRTHAHTRAHTYTSPSPASTLSCLYTHQAATVIPTVAVTATASAAKCDAVTFSALSSEIALTTALASKSRLLCL
jgi:hypothetical protein